MENDFIKKSFINKDNKSLKGKSNRKKLTDFIAYGLIGVATTFTIAVLLWILGFIFVNGISKINIDFLTSNFDSETQYVNVETCEGTDNKLGIILGTLEIEGKTYISIDKVEKNSKVKNATNKKGEIFKITEGDLIKKVGDTKLKEIEVNTEGLETKEDIEDAIEKAHLVAIEETNQIINSQQGNIINIKATDPGEGILPMIITTLLMIFISLIIACPIGIFAAIYLTEYAKPGKLVRIIRFATESLSGIPSIIYGLFGMIFFVIALNLNYSILSGALTLSIILLPVIIRQTEESLKAVPVSYREGSLGLGASKLHTVRKAVLPSAVPGIIVAIILSIGRIIGESAALLLTAGTIARIPDNLLTSGATLTVKAYAVAKETGDISMACAIGTVIVIIILILNGLSKIFSKKYSN